MQNKNDINIMLKEAGILFAITLIAGLLLGFVYELTKDAIAAQEAQAQTDACKAVFSDAVSFEEDASLSETVLGEFGEDENEFFAKNGLKPGKIYYAMDAEGQNLGLVVEIASTRGYGGTIDLYVGFRKGNGGEAGLINGVSILEISETVGLGMEAENILVPQFDNVPMQTYTYTKTGAVQSNEIDAISGATITTDAFVNAVNGAGIMASHIFER